MGAKVREEYAMFDRIDSRLDKVLAGYNLTEMNRMDIKLAVMELIRDELILAAETMGVEL